MAVQATQANGDWTVGRLLDWTRQHFQSHGIEDARLCAELLLAKAMDCRKIMLYTRYNDSPTESQRATFRELVKAAAEHRPIAYLIGHREFYSLDFKVTPDVLVPRPETELIVERALAWCKARASQSYSLLDIGTGSGCIAITLCKRIPTMTAVATDISSGALAVAAENAAALGVSDRVRFVEADLLSLPPELLPTDGFDLVVSNPPYVAESDAESLPRAVRDYEPASALFAGADGLSIYRRLASSAAAVVRRGGVLLLEIGRGQGDAVTAMFQDAGMTLAGRYRDLAGIERTLEFTMTA